ncbi:hypothetical protein BS47DRAFT_1388304 [Hydnum rufescens UP504]|uniref:RecA family profile 1 domain-containing protein n=1 Tax=Hydnum rufescens UP504 TaxID=1448309 RepID=A0A9P6B919_9AGAM|nr:hypothetical protein BS47DRAFT_1388304 [Hydnum rufescens UP504]
MACSSFPLPCERPLTPVHSIIAGLLTPLDVLVLPHQELARKLHVVDAHHIIDAISRAIAPQPVIIDNSFKGTAESIATGDDAFDALLGGGITTGAIWEVVGESSSGKTQLALQLSLMALLSPISGDIERSTCYITSSGELPTERLVQIFKNHPKLSHVPRSHERLMLDNTQQRQITSRHQLLQALSDDLPKLAEHRILLGMPLKLIVIDALTPLVQPEGKANTAKLAERSQHLVEISGLLRSLAWKYDLAVLVL